MLSPHAHRPISNDVERESFSRASPLYLFMRVVQDLR